LVCPVETQAQVVVEKNLPQSFILLGENPTWIEKHGAEELVKYIKAMSGVEIKVCQGKTNQAAEKNIILIGRPETHSLIQRLCIKGIVRLSPEYPGLDGFIVKTVKFEDKNYLVLGGSIDRGTLYAVYHLLEEVCRLGFFEDGEHIPKKETIKFAHLDIAKRPYFPVRQCIQQCAFTYNAMFWDFDDWKKEIDWMLKKKYNTGFIGTGRFRHVTAKRVFQKMGYEMALTESEKYRFELYKKILHYARNCGFQAINPCGYISPIPEFKKSHPEIKYIEMRPGEFHIHPADPWHAKLITLYTQEYNRNFGTSHIYECDPYPERTPGKSREEDIQIKIAFAKSVVKGLKEIDPKAKWYISGWGFYAPGWPKETAKAFFNAIPDDMVLIHDFWAQKYSIYRKYDYFYNRDWLFGIGELAGSVTMHGDISELIRRVKQITVDPNAKNCKGLYPNPESIMHNFLYYDLVAELAWDPRKVTLKSFLQDYAIRRYGKESAPTMVKCLRELVKSVYNTDDLTPPLYQVSPYRHHVISNNKPEAPAANVVKRFLFIPHLKKSLEYALQEKEIQKNNTCYRRDLVEISKQYIGEIFNYEFVKLLDSYYEGNREDFDEQIKIISLLFDLQENVLHTHRAYLMASEIETSKSFPQVRKHQPNDMYIRSKRTIPIPDSPDWKEKMNWKSKIFYSEYCRRDLYELVKYFYRRRVEAFIQALRKKMEHPETKLRQEAISLLVQVSKEWLGSPLPAIEEKGQTWKEVVDSCGKLEPIAEMINKELAANKWLLIPKPGKKIGWEENFSTTAGWKPYLGGISFAPFQDVKTVGAYTSDGRILTLASREHWFRYKKHITPHVKVKNYPVLNFRYRITSELPNDVPTIFIDWIDTSGKGHKSLVWEGRARQWTEVNIDLSESLYFHTLMLIYSPELSGEKPDRVTGIHIHNPDVPAVVQWDWIRLTAKE